MRFGNGGGRGLNGVGMKQQAKAEPVLRPSSQSKRARSFENTSLTKILNGTMRAIGQRGIRKLSMNDIAEASGVSRGTLYRYFPTKEDALEAVAEHVSVQFERGVVDVALSCESVEQVLEAVLKYHFTVTVEQQGASFLEKEPEFVLGFFRSHLPRHVSALTAALDPYYDHVERDTGYSLDRMLCSEALIRLQLSTILVPAGRTWSRMPKLVWQFMSLLGGSDVDAVSVEPPVLAVARPAMARPLADIVQA